MRQHLNKLKIHRLTDLFTDRLIYRHLALFRKGQDWIGKESSGLVRTVQDGSGQVRTVQKGQDRSGQVRRGQDRTGQVRTGRDR